MPEPISLGEMSDHHRQSDGKRRKVNLKVGQQHDGKHHKVRVEIMTTKFRRFLDTFVATSTFPISENLPEFWENAERELDALPREHQWTVEPETLAEWVKDARSLK